LKVIETPDSLADAYAKLAWAGVHIKALIAAITGFNENAAPPVTTVDTSANPYDHLFKPLSPSGEPCQYLSRKILG
jgi:hypothetical protein